MSHGETTNVTGGCHRVRHTVSQAAELVGKDRRTVYRHIKAGRLSCGFDEDGHQFIDTSELIRVYGAVTLPETPMSQPVTPKMSHGETANVTALIADLVKQIEGLTGQLAAIQKELAERPRIEHKPESKPAVDSVPAKSKPKPKPKKRKQKSKPPVQGSQREPTFSEILERCRARWAADEKQKG